MTPAKSMMLIGFLLIATSGISTCEPVNLYHSFKSVGYYPDYNNWQVSSTYLRMNRFTHVIFFSIYPDTNGNLKFTEVDLSHLVSLVSDAHAANVNVLIGIGGWGLSGGFSAMAADASARTAFIANVRDFCLAYDLDGVDLDWEPVTSTSDRSNYTTLITEMKPVLAQQGLSLSVAVFAGGQEFLPSAISSIDWIGIMAYDLGFPHSSFEDAVTALNHWEAFGFERSKIVLGIPFYGRDEWGGYYSYQFIMNNYQPDANTDITAKISFNGVTTVKQKTAHVLSNKYGGVMFWEITQDTTDATSLLTATAETVHLNSQPDFDNNGIINVDDLRHFVAGWLLNDCTEHNTWCDRADLDASGYVNLSDLAVIAASWATN